MRTINADALIEVLEPHGLGKGSAIGWHSGIIDAVIDEIQKMPTIGGWVSVEDRLPEHIGWYLVSLVNNRNGHRWKTPVVCEYSFDVWHENDLFSNDVDATVTHWMPLPEPPKEVSGDV